MKNKTLFAVFFLTLFGCRENRVELCAGEYEIATEVLVEAESFDTDGALAVPAGDWTDVDKYKLRIHVVSGRNMNLFQDVEWRISDPTLVSLSALHADPDGHLEASAIVETTADILDRSGETEPETTITVCVQNDCADYAGGEGCAACLPEVCSRPYKVRAIVNAEGDWRLQGATFPYPVPIRVKQTGRELTAAFFEPSIHGTQINFSSGSTSYVGQFTDHEHVTGEAIVSPSGDNLGVWTAEKCPATGCEGTGP